MPTEISARCSQCGHEHQYPPSGSNLCRNCFNAEVRALTAECPQCSDHGCEQCEEVHHAEAAASAEREGQKMDRNAALGALMFASAIAVGGSLFMTCLTAFLGI